MTPPGIRAVRITKTLGGLSVLNCVSLNVGQSEIHALVGLNGAGKTTLLRILLGHAQRFSFKAGFVCPGP